MAFDVCLLTLALVPANAPGASLVAVAGVVQFAQHLGRKRGDAEADGQVSGKRRRRIVRGFA